MNPTSPRPQIRRLVVTGLRCIAAATTLVFWVTAPPRSWAQESSLFRQPPPNGFPAAAGYDANGSEPAAAAQASAPYGQGVLMHDGLAQSSWLYTPPVPLRTFQKNDVITIRVDEIARMMAEGRAQSRKVTQYHALITDWLRLSNGRIEPDPLEEGDPALGSQSNNQFRAQSEINSREALSFSIAARIVDIRPNGNLVVEARKTLRVNDNLWETSLTGTCRAQDVGPDNVVLSRDLLDLEIDKQDQGHLRDGYKRGWVSRWLGRIQPF